MRFARKQLHLQPRRAASQHKTGPLFPATETESPRSHLALIRFANGELKIFLYNWNSFSVDELKRALRSHLGWAFQRETLATNIFAAKMGFFAPMPTHTAFPSGVTPPSSLLSVHTAAATMPDAAMFKNLRLLQSLTTEEQAPRNRENLTRTRDEVSRQRLFDELKGFVSKSVRYVCVCRSTLCCFARMLLCVLSICLTSLPLFCFSLTLPPFVASTGKDKATHC